MDTSNADFDSVWKQAAVRYIADFAELFLREKWAGAPVPESLDQELGRCSRDGRLGPRRVDKLLRAVGPDGGPCLWHIEVQVARQRGFGERMFVCQYRLYDHFRLPVRSIAILGDPSPTWRPSSFELAAGRTQVTFMFETIKLRDFEPSLADLLLSDNVFAWLVSAHLFTLRTRREPEARMLVKGCLLTGLRSCGWSDQKFRDVYDLIDRMMKLPQALQDQVDEQQRMIEGGQEMAWKYLFEERAEERGMQRGIAAGLEQGLQKGVQEGWQKGRQEGREEGREEGRVEGRVEALRQTLLSQLAVRFGPPGEDVRRRVEAAGYDDLARWCLAVVTARSIEEVF